MTDIMAAMQGSGSSTTQEFAALSTVLRDVETACASLPQDEQVRHRDAQQSVVDARRRAESQEGLLQIC